MTEPGLVWVRKVIEELNDQIRETNLVDEYVLDFYESPIDVLDPKQFEELRQLPADEVGQRIEAIGWMGTQADREILEYLAGNIIDFLDTEDVNRDWWNQIVNHGSVCAYWG